MQFLVRATLVDQVYVVCRGGGCGKEKDECSEKEERVNVVFCFDDHSPNQENGVPCFTSPVNLTSPSCLRRKKLFAITPTFALPDESQL